MMDFETFQRYEFQKQQDAYWRNLSLQTDGADHLPVAQKGRLIPPIYLGRFSELLFGGNTLDVQTSGNVMVDFGGLWQRVDNPQIPVRQQRNGGFNFDQQIALSLMGRIGDKLQISGNFDTKSAFQFEQQFKVAYNAYDHDIVQDLQLGNVNFQVANSLIRGTQNLFGMYTRLRFGNLFVTAVASNQRGTRETIVIKNGALSRDFELRADTYEANRHFFLSEFFRGLYEQSLRNTPMVQSPVRITRVKVFVMNRANTTQSLRTVVGLLDLGAPDPFRPQWGGGRTPADNKVNGLYQTISTLGRVPETLPMGLQSLGLERGTDFELITSARELTEQEFILNPQLGYLSLQTPLRNDEMLAVAFEYTHNGKVYKVGELNEDYVSIGANDAVFLKLLKPASVRTDLPTWDLMMKNIYALQGNQIQQDNFQMRVIYRDDRTGVDNPSLHEGSNTANVPLVRLMGLDRLNMNKELQPDGNFDFVEGVTIDSRNGRIVFPVLEPFGATMDSKFTDAEQELRRTYVFSQLYRKTQADAQLNTFNNKYYLKGSYQAGTAGEIALPGLNIAPGSVVVTTRGATLAEGVDYTVDYQFGRLRMLNEAIMGTGAEIVIQFERADMFNFQTRTMTGVDLEYRVNNNLRLTTTLMNLSEKPLVSRVGIGNEPVNNLMWGTSMDYRAPSQWLTRLVDAIPGVTTSQPSSISFKGEFAQLIPRAPKLVGQDGAGYIDDFEAAEISYDLSRNPTQWAIGATPKHILQKFPAVEPQAYNYKRARMAWYNIDNVFYFSNGLTQRPQNITAEDLRNHYVRMIPYNEVFQNRQANQINLNEITFDLAYYPEERGPYNYNPDLTAEGKLPNPEQNFGAITRAIGSDVDFDNINVQYAEFWLMDPFLPGERGKVEGKNNTTGGELYLNLGNVSEDVIPDGRHFFENGLGADPLINHKDNVWGYTPNTQYLNNAFNPAVPREAQDVGLNGMNSGAEREFLKDYLDRVSGRVNASALENIRQDPAGDDFVYYLDQSLDAQNAGVLQRYKRFNGVEGNSPANAGGSQYPASSTNIPDNEDLNRDNTVSSLDAYFQYKVPLYPGKLDANNPYITDVVEATAPETGERVRWYQFRIPLRGAQVDTVGAIDNLKTVRFVRLFMTNWKQPVVLRMLNFQLVGGQWRPYEANIEDPKQPVQPSPSTKVTVSTVNIEENGSANGEYIPYVIPPGVVRDYDATSTVTRQINEQSVQLKVEGLRNGDSRAIYKNLTFDMVNYRRLKMELHAHSRTAADGEVMGFVRLGTDLTNNYYEIEVPLTITSPASVTPEAIWPAANQIDIAIDELYAIKKERTNVGASLMEPYPQGNQPNVRQYRVRIVGRPDLSSVQSVMIGVRNPATDDGHDKDVTIWANELRATEYNTFSGWATNLAMNAQLADVATVSAALRYSTAGFGGIQDKLNARQRSDNLYYSVSSNINLDKFYLHKLGITLPLYLNFERGMNTPYFDPLDPDVPLDVALDYFDTPSARQDYRSRIQEIHRSRTIGVSGLRKQRLNPQAVARPWDVENFTLFGSYTESFDRGRNIDALRNLQWRGGIGYAFQSQAKPWEPFKDVQAFDKPAWALLKDFNLALPTAFSVRAELDRRYRETQYRNGELSTEGIDPLYEKSFLFNRNYALNWALTRSLNIDYQATNQSLVDEPFGALDTKAKKDSVMANVFNLGRTKRFDQNVALSYRLPLDKLPAFDWVSADARYVGQSSFIAGTLGMADSLGNVLQNGQQVSVNTRFSFVKIYEKIPFFKKVMERSRMRNPEKYDPLLELWKDRERKWQDKLGRLQEKQQQRWAQGDSLSSLQRRIAKLEGRLAELQSRIALQQKKQQVQLAGKVLAYTADRLMMVKDADIVYAENRATTLPGYALTPTYFGFAQQFSAPGLPFLLGSQDADIRFKAAEKGWLVHNERQLSPFSQTSNAELRLRMGLEPFKEFKLTLESFWRKGDAYAEVFRYLPDEQRFESQSAQRTGNWASSFFSLPTAFREFGVEGGSAAYKTFLDYREQVQQRLNDMVGEDRYKLNDQDVIVPAFIAAYGGRKPSLKGTSAFPSLPIPGWQLSYTGLSKLEMFKGMFSNVTLTHRYSSTYEVGNYASSLQYGASVVGPNLQPGNAPMGDLDDNGNIVPVFVYSQVAIDERFAPLIGLNIRTVGNWQFQADISKSRRVGLSMVNAQLTEMRNNDFRFDVGYTKAGLRLPIRWQGKPMVLQNDVTFRMGFSLRESVVMQRNNDGGSFITQGNMSFQLKPTINYMLNTRTSVQLYFERTINDPKVSNAFRRTTTAGGFQFRYSLTQ